MNGRVFLTATLILTLALTSVGWAQRGYVRHDLQIKSEDGQAVTDITSIKICTTGTTTAQTIYKDALLTTAVTNPITTVSSNTTLTQANGTCYWYGIDAYDIVAISTQYGTITAKGYSSSRGTLIFPTYWAASQSQTSTDAQSFALGTDSDWVLQGGATADRLTMTPATDGATLYFGSATRQADLTWFSGTGTTYVVWSQAGNTETYTGVDAVFSDTAKAKFGTDSDFSFYSSTAKQLDIVPTVADESPILNIGADTTGVNVKFFAATTGDYAYWDAANETFNILDATLSLGDSDKLLFGDNVGTGDLYLESTTNVLTLGQVVAGTGTFVLGVDGKGIDTTFYGETASSYMKWDQDGFTNGALLINAASINLADGDGLYFGSALGTGDFKISDETDVLTFDVVAAGTGEIAIGNDADDVPTKWFGETTGAFWYFTGDQLQGDKVSLALGDGDKILFGDTLGTGDFSISDEGDVLTFTQIVADTGAVAWGANDAGMDQTWYGESAGAYMKWDATGADKLILNGIDSSGTLFGITAIDTTGNSDTMTITHSGTGSGLKVTASTATAVNETLVAATSQTTSVLKVDGTTGSWLGADATGMVNLTNDGALAHVNSSLLYIANTGVPQNDSRGSSLRIVDTGNAAAGTAGYAVYISATDATVEAMYVDDGNVLVDDYIRSAKGVQSSQVTVAADVEASQVTIPAGTRFALITSDGATKVVCLPNATAGDMIEIYCAATGCELQTLASSNATINAVDCDGANEMAIAAGAVYHLVCVATNTWIAYGWGADGAAIATITPDADS